LFRGVAGSTSATGSGHGAKFLSQFHPDVHAAETARKVADHFTGVPGVLIDVNDERYVAGFIESDGGAEDFRLPHPIRGYFVLNGHDRTDVRMRFIENSGRRPGEGTEGNKSGENSGR
jgi:hypothetical protein